ncbi:hypothetical protein TRFO_12341 [Tritrichomonas foetus]|uniref:Serine/threonine-protein phosphatase 4 regulatory subunit 3-like central domain-containing protein n=1 Tax=Tritrichomonas foetus TaxID=1144522 RepID=A0A1J4J555_9EUKA|nr:hypothetical protein TRFO_12341 [Tritrichomonas foetus]|eukprot:OHS92779.1 hypothetical protein TRFO_12341 [Tritrichomonas foetus]
MFPSIFDLLNHKDEDLKANSVRRTRRVDNQSTKFQDGVVYQGIDELPKKTFDKLYSENPEVIYDGLQNIPGLYLITYFAPAPPPEIISKLFTFVNSSPPQTNNDFPQIDGMPQINDNSIYERISYQAADDLYVLFIKFPELRKFLFDNQFYLPLMKHLDRIIYTSFTEAVEIEPSILNELSKFGIIENIVNFIKTSPSISLVSNIILFGTFLEHQIEQSINYCLEVSSLLMNYAVNPQSEIQPNVLDFFAIAIPFIHEMLIENDFFAFLIHNCIGFEDCSYCSSLKVLRNATNFCADYLLNKNLISLIHAVFAKDNDFVQPEIYAIQICTIICQKGPELFNRILSSDLSKDLVHYSTSGSLAEKKEFMKLIIALVNFANMNNVSDFLAEISCVHSIADFLETYTNELFESLLKSLLCLIDLEKKMCLTENLRSELKSVLESPPVIKTIENFVSENSEFAELAQNIIKYSQENIVNE